jgi:colanic acid/amylovoran biosynthesis glycosyltransferase
VKAAPGSELRAGDGRENWRRSDGESRVVVVTPYEPSLYETFIRAHIEQLPANVLVIQGWPPRIGGRAILSWPRRATHRLWRLVSRAQTHSATLAYLKAFQRHCPWAVLAEYGPMGVVALPACRHAGIPLIVHFHGFDASVDEVLRAHAETYPRLFAEAAAIIAVSLAMRAKLIGLGAPPAKVHYNAYGVDCREFEGGDPARAAAAFVAVGRFTPKKAPDVTLRAFAEVHRRVRASTLRMVGDGPLLTVCRTLANELGIDKAVTFLGAQPPTIVREEMRRARCFVQHSVKAASGDCEGTPVVILEAGATGLPVVSTRHGGIPDVVIEGETGFLVEEHDVRGMARHMLLLAEDTGTAGRLGRAARARVEAQFSIERSIAQLWRIMRASARADRPAPGTRDA